MVKTCIVCQKIDSKKNPLIKEPLPEHKTNELIKRCEYLKSNGDFSTKSLLERLYAAKNTGLLTCVRYHSECRKPVMNDKKKRSYPGPPSQTPLKKVGRPELKTPEVRPKRISSSPKEIKCVFSACSFCPPSSDFEELHKIKTDNVGFKLIDIQKNTKDDVVRVCLSDLQSKGTSFCLERYITINIV